MNKDQVKAVVIANQKTINEFLTKVKEEFGLGKVEGKDGDYFELRYDHNGKLEMVHAIKSVTAPCGFRFYFIAEADPEWSYVEDHIWWGKMDLETLTRVKVEIEANRKLMDAFNDCVRVKREEIEDFFA